MPKEPRGLTQTEVAAGNFSPAVSKEVLSGQDVRRTAFRWLY